MNHPNVLQVIKQTTQGNAVVGANFLAYWPSGLDAVDLAALTHDATPTSVGNNVDVPARMAATCHRLAFAVDQRSGGGLTLKPVQTAIIINVLTLRG